jgi:outer membrane protein TolC
MKRKTIILVYLLCIYSSSFAQLSLEDCHAKARANYPLIQQYSLIERARDYNLSNVRRGYLPQIQFSAKASYQSEVTEIPIDFSKLEIPNMAVPQLSKDQYNASIDINQMIWDGGVIRTKRESIQANADVEQKSVDVSLYALKERINELFFGILLCEALIEQNRLFQEELQRHYDRISSLIENGMANRSDLDVVKVEQLKAKQLLANIVHNKKNCLAMMSAFTGEQLDENIKLQKPETAIQLSSEIQRLELTLFDAQYQSINVVKKEIRADVMPVLGLFVSGGYGKPGLNMLKDDFSAYCIGGVRLSWKIGNFYMLKNRKNLIETNRNTIQVRRETFLFNTTLNKTAQEHEIDKYHELLQLDDEIIALRKAVKQSTEAKVAGGTSNTTDLMRDVNAEQMAKQDRSVHEIELTKAIYHLKFIINQ